jgi:hypothetical protein
MSKSIQLGSKPTVGSLALFSNRCGRQKDLESSLSYEDHSDSEHKETPLFQNKNHPVDTSSLSTKLCIDTQLPPSTRTPSYNDQVESALAFFAWLTSLSYNENMLEDCCSHNPTRRKPNSSSEELKDIAKLMSPSTVFCPIKPLMEDHMNDNQDGDKTTASSPISCPYPH